MIPILLGTVDAGSDAKKWCRPLGTTPTSHIFKLPIGFIQHQQMDLRDSCENEWLCSQIAEAFSLPVAKCEILHYRWHNIQRRHFLETAKAVNYSPERAEGILDEMLQQVDSVIEQVSIKLPKGFPRNISQPVFDGMQLMKRRLLP